MPVFTVEKDGRYKQGVGANAKYVAAHEVPESVKKALTGTAPGSMVDELGDKFDPATDTEESTDETLPTKTPEDKQPTPKKDVAKSAQKSFKKATQPKDQTEEDQEEDVEDEDEIVDPNNTPVEQDEEGMGWPRSGGKTLSIFSNKPHETVKSVGGQLVPMTHEEYESKTDAEILKKLRSMKRI